MTVSHETESPLAQIPPLTIVFSAPGEVFFQTGEKREHCQLVRIRDAMAGKNIYPGILAKPFPHGHVLPPKALPERKKINKYLKSVL